MSFVLRLLAILLCSLLAFSAHSRGEDKPAYNGPACGRNVDDYFAKEVWPKVGAALCLQCHKKGGDAEESKLILRDPRKVQGHAQEEAMRHNRDAFSRLARVKDGAQFRILVK